MNAEVKEVEINGVCYVPKGSVEKQAEQLDGLDYVIVRTYSAGVFAGYLKKKEGKECELKNSRRIWYWNGAASLSQLAVEGTNKPNDCKFACLVGREELTEAIEVLYCTEKARKNIQEVKEWKM